MRRIWKDSSRTLEKSWTPRRAIHGGEGLLQENEFQRRYPSPVLRCDPRRDAVRLSLTRWTHKCEELKVLIEHGKVFSGFMEHELTFPPSFR